MPRGIGYGRRRGRAGRVRFRGGMRRRGRARKMQLKVKRALRGAIARRIGRRL